MPVTLDQILDHHPAAACPPCRPGARPWSGRRRRGPAPPSFRARSGGRTVAVIAEVKRRSPSAGSIREDLDPGRARRARTPRHGAAAISVLTDGPYFGGSLRGPRAAAVGRVAVPVLRKDFILDELQILEARAAGAAAVLLIVRALAPARLAALLALRRATAASRRWSRCTRPTELDTRARRRRRDLGVNSRDLDTFRIDTATAWTMLARGAAATASRSRRAAWRAPRTSSAAAAAGADAVLIGTALSAAAEPGALLGDAQRGCRAVAASRASRSAA